MTTGTKSIKSQARQLVEQLGDDATWEDLMYQIYVRQAVDMGLKDLDEGRTLTTAEVRQRLGLPR